jgi:hypothetical protein
VRNDASINEFGNVVNAVGHGTYMVAFDNGETIKFCSYRLRVKARTSAILPDIPPEQALESPAYAPDHSTAEAEQKIHEPIKAIENSHEDEEHIPSAQDKDDEESNNGAGDDKSLEPVGVAEQQVHDPDG